MFIFSQTDELFSQIMNTKLQDHVKALQTVSLVAYTNSNEKAVEKQMQTQSQVGFYNLESERRE